MVPTQQRARSAFRLGFECLRLVPDRGMLGQLPDGDQLKNNNPTLSTAMPPVDRGAKSSTDQGLLPAWPRHIRALRTESRSPYGSRREFERWPVHPL